MNTTLPLVGTYSPHSKHPTFAIPIFRSGECYLVQEEGKDGRIQRFIPCDIDRNALRPLTKEKTVLRQIGQSALHAFIDPARRVHVGEKNEIIEILGRVRAELESHPFILLDAASFLNDADLRDRASAACKSILDETRRRGSAGPILNKVGVFYPSFLRRLSPLGEQLYTNEDQDCIERTVHKLLAVPTSASKPGMLLGKVQSGKTKTFMAITALAFDNGYDAAVVLTKGTRALAKQTFHRLQHEFGAFVDSDQVLVFDILAIPERLTAFELKKKLLFVVKKQSDNLERLMTLFVGPEDPPDSGWRKPSAYPQLRAKRLLIIDDEADNASIGYGLNPNKELELRTISGQIDELRRHLSGASFLQVTATPYSLYLQPEDEPIPGSGCMPVRPAFTELVPVHTAYVGGDFYFRDSTVPGSVASFVFHKVDPAELAVLKSPDRRVFKNEECLASEKVKSLRAALMNFIVGGCLRRIQDEQAGRSAKKFSFLFHTEAGKAAHDWQQTVVLTFEDKLREAAETNPLLLSPLINEAYADLERSVQAAGHPLPDRELVRGRVLTALREGELMVTKVNSEAQVETLLDASGQLNLRNPLNIFIGGQILDRGITLGNMIGFFYGRNPQRFQQDTVMQHSRMYGARPPEDCAVTRFYTAQHIYDAMAEMHETDTALRERIKAQGDEQRVPFVELDESGRITPCSPNKILAATTTTIRPHRRILPVGFQTDYKVRLWPITEAVDQRLARLTKVPKPGEAPQPVEVGLEEALPIIDLLGPAFIMEEGYENRWDPHEFKGMLTHLATRGERSRPGRVLLMLRTGRNLSRKPPKGTSHVEFSDLPDDPQTDAVMAKRAAIHLPVLALIRQEGKSEGRGWRDCPFWWPVLFAPEKMRPAVFAHKR